MTDPRAVIDRHIDAFNTRTPDAEPWADDADIVTPAGTFTGRGSVLGFLAGFQQAFSDAALAIDSAVIDGDAASVEGTFTGTHDGPLQSPAGAIEPTGHAVTFRWSATYLTDGQVLKTEHLYFDQLDFLTQLGAIPAPNRT